MMAGYRLGWLSGLILCTLLLSGCFSLETKRDYMSPGVRSPTRPSTYALYLPNRVLDLLDVPSAALQFGPGLNVHFKATQALAVTFPFNACGPAVGWNVDYTNPIEEGEIGYFWRRFKPLAHGCRGGKHAPFLPIVKVNLGELEQPGFAWEIGTHLFFVGANITLRPVELADFVTGFVLFDINNDDIREKRD